MAIIMKKEVLSIFVTVQFVKTQSLKNRFKKRCWISNMQVIGQIQ